MKLSDSGNAGFGLTANRTPPPRARSATGSGSEPPPSREQSNGSGGAGSDLLMHMSRPANGSPRDVPSTYPSRQSSRRAPDSGEGFHRRNLPSLSDVFEGRSLSNGIAAAGEASAYAGYPRPSANDSPGPPSSLLNGDSGPPSLSKAYSSAGSTSSTHSFPRTPIEGSLPIHALLSGHPGPPFDASKARDPYMAGETAASGAAHNAATPVVTSPGISSLLNGGPGYFGSPPPGQNHALVASPQYMSNGVSPQRQSARPAPASEVDGNGLDAISALLRAGEIVDRQQ